MGVMDTQTVLQPEDLDLNLVMSLQKTLLTQLSSVTIISKYMERPDKVAMQSVKQWIEMEIISFPVKEKHGIVQFRCRVKLSEANPGRTALALKDSLINALNAPSFQIYNCATPSNPTVISGVWGALRLLSKEVPGGAFENVHEEIVRYQLICWQDGLID